MQLLHPFHEQFTDQSGAKILRQFTFSQTKTKIGQVSPLSSLEGICETDRSLSPCNIIFCNQACNFSADRLISSLKKMKINSYNNAQDCRVGLLKPKIKFSSLHAFALCGQSSGFFLNSLSHPCSQNGAIKS